MTWIQLILLILLVIGTISAAYSITLNQRWIKVAFKYVLKGAHQDLDNYAVPNAPFWIDVVMKLINYGSQLYHFALLILTVMAGFMIYQENSLARIIFAVIMIGITGYDFFSNVRPLYKHLQIKDYYLHKWQKRYPGVPFDDNNENQGDK